MFAFILMLQPAPAAKPIPATLIRVDVIVVNQFNSRTTSVGEDGVTRHHFRAYWYDSFWDVHYLPPWGMCRVAVWCHRGWRVSAPLGKCADGWTAEYGKKTIVAPRVLFIESTFDFEYRNRSWINWH